MPAAEPITFARSVLCHKAHRMTPGRCKKRMGKYTKELNFMLHTIGKYVAFATLGVSALSAANAQSIKGTINLPGTPEDVAVNYLTNRIYVAIPSFGGPTDTLAVIDGNTDTLIQSISIPTVGYTVAVDTVRNLVYVGGCFEDVNGLNRCEVAVVNGKQNSLAQTIPVTTSQGNGIQGLAVNQLTGTVYVSNASDNVIDVIEPGAKAVCSTISLAGESPVGVAVNPFTNQVYVALSNDLVDVIDGRKKTIVATATVGTSNANVASNWISGNVFVVNSVEGVSTVGVLNSKGGNVAAVTVGNTPFGVDVDLATNLAFVTNLIDNSVSVINGKTNTVSATLPVSGTFVAVNPATAKVYVSGQVNQLIVLNEK
jgi:YVTN family beta-propeller protein